MCCKLFSHLGIDSLAHISASMSDGNSAIMRVDIDQATKTEGASIANGEAEGHKCYASLPPPVSLKRIPKIKNVRLSGKMII